MSDRTQTRVRVRVLIEIDSDGGGWGGDCTLDQAWKQGEKSALDRLRRLINNANEHRSIRLIGEPETVAVIVKGAGDE